MSNLLKDSTPSSLLDECSIIDGRHQILHVAPCIADISGIHISRGLPSRNHRILGAWCFLGHAGPVVLKEAAAAVTRWIELERSNLNSLVEKVPALEDYLNLEWVVEKFSKYPEYWQHAMAQTPKGKPAP